MMDISVIDGGLRSVEASSLDLAVNAWSVQGSDLNSSDLASTFFAVSLVPYLAFLWFIGQPVNKTPAQTNFGFRFLLAFVLATIPAGIVAKVQYHDILANVDWLHGSAESLLTVTNLCIILGFREARRQKEEDERRERLLSTMSDTTSPTNDPSMNTNSWLDLGLAVGDAAKSIPNAGVVGTLVVLTSLGLGAITGAGDGIVPHVEPTNALSLPTWAVHSSSIIEWLAAMRLSWQHAEVSGNPRWKGLSWGMLPSHTSGLCACTFHFFYNSPNVDWLVPVQAFLTVFGNTTLAWAAWRIWMYGKKINADTDADTDANPTQTDDVCGSTSLIISADTATPDEGRSGVGLSELLGGGVMAVGISRPGVSDKTALLSLTLTSVAVAAMVKFGETYLGMPFWDSGAESMGAAVLVLTPTLALAALYSILGNRDGERVT